MTKIDDVKFNVEKGKTKLISGLVQEALDEGSSAKDILDAMVEGMGAVGDRFSSGEIFVPEMLIAAKAMSKGVEVLKPHLSGGSGTSFGTCIIGTVQGDLHDIGVDVPPEKFIEAVKANENVSLVACSGLLSTTMPALKKTVESIKNSGLSGFKIIVGGAPVTQDFADEIGADAYASDAGSAAVKAKEIVSAA